MTLPLSPTAPRTLQIDDGAGREAVHLARHLDRLISGS